MTAKTATPVSRMPEQSIQQQLNRILARKTFDQVDRLKRFVNFTVVEGMAGRGGELKEYVIGVQVFDKEPSFDPRTDPIVRVQARRLRARLVRCYREAPITRAVARWARFAVACETRSSTRSRR
jgi:serine/threonine-protein kinase